MHILTELLSLAIRDKEPMMLFNGKIDWLSVFEIARDHQVHTLLYPIIQKLDKNALPDTDLLDRWKQIVFIESTIQTRHVNQMRNVLQAFAGANIKVIVLKGLILRELYPYPFLRTMCDADLYLHWEDLDSAKKILINMGYFEDHKQSKKEIGFYKNGFLHIELHWKLNEPEVTIINSISLENSIWQNAISSKTCSEQTLSLSAEDQVVYLIFHMAKHFLDAGFGLRSLCDLVLLIESNKNQLNWNYIIQKSEECNTLSFTQATLISCQKLFNLEIPKLFNSKDMEKDPLLEVFLEDIFAIICGKSTKVFTKSIAMMLVNLRNKDDSQESSGKFNYFLSFMFPSIKHLATRYSYLSITPFLYPVAWLHRIITGFRLKRTISQKIQMLLTMESAAQKRYRLLHWLKLG